MVFKWGNVHCTVPIFWPVPTGAPGPLPPLEEGAPGGGQGPPAPLAVDVTKKKKKLRLPPKKWIVHDN